MKKINMLIYAGTKEQYLLFEQLYNYFITTFNINHSDCLTKLLNIIQETFNSRNISIVDFSTINEQEQKSIISEIIEGLISAYQLEQDQAKISFECIKLYKDWKDDFS